MVFDLSTAKEATGGFDINSAKPVPMNNIKVYHEETGKTIEMPDSYDDKEIEFTSQTVGGGKNPNKFMGMTEMPEDDAGFFESVGNTLRQLPKGFKAGFKQAPQVYGGIVKQLAETQQRVPSSLDPLRSLATYELAFEDEVDPLPINTAMQETANKIITENRAMLERQGLVRPEEKGLDSFLFDVGQGSASLLVALGLTAVTKSPLPASALFGGIQNSNLYIEGREKGLSPQESAKVAGLGGVAEAGLEMIGLDRFFKIGLGDKIIKRAMKRATVEAIQEGSQTGAEAAITQAAGVRDITLEQAGQDIAYSAMLGGVLGGGASVVMATAERKAKSVGMTQKQVDTIKKAVTESGSIERMGELISKEAVKTSYPDKSEAERASIVQKAMAETDIQIKAPKEDKPEVDVIQQRAEEQRKKAESPIIAQINKKQADDIKAVQDEVDDIKITALREVEDILQQTEPLDTETKELLEQTASLLSEKRTIKKPQTFLAYIKSKGGLVDTGGELSSIGVSKQQLAKWKKTGYTFDDMGELAWEDGFFLERPTVAEVLLAFEEDFKGNLVYNAAEIGAASELNNIEEGLVQLDRALSDKGVLFNRPLLLELRGRVSRNMRINKRAVRQELARAKEVAKLAAKEERLKESPPKILADKLATFRRGLRTGEVIGRSQVKDVQTAIIKTLDESGLAAEDKAKFLKTIKNIQTSAQLDKNLADIEARVDELVESAERRQLRISLKKALKDIKPKKQSGKIKGKFTAEIQDILSAAQKALSLSKGDAQSILNVRLEQTEGMPSVEDAIQNKILALVADGAEAPVADLQGLLNDILRYKETGRAENLSKQLARRERIVGLRERAITTVTEGENIHIEDETSFNAKIKKGAKNAAALLSGWNYGWYDTLDVIFNKKSAKRGDALRDEFMVSELFQDEKGLRREMSQKLEDAAKESLGVAGKELLKKFAEDAQVEPLGLFTNTAGVDVRLQYSRAEARKLWMEYQDPTLTETITRKLTKEEFRDGKGNGYTQDMLNGIFGLLSKKDYAFARSQLRIYQEFYKDINDIYSEVYGVNLPKNKFYSPISRQVGNEVTSDEFLKDMGYRRSVAPGGLKVRVSNTRTLKKQSDVVTMQRHIVEMTHFITFATKTQELNAVFGNKAVRDAITAKNGKFMLDVVDGFVEDFIRGGVKRGGALDRILNTLNSNFAKSVLAAKPALAAKQFTAFVSYAETIPTKAFISGIADFAQNRKKAVDILSKSNLMQDRGVSIDQEIARAGQQVDFDFFRKKARLDELLLKPIQWGDRGSIYVGGWAVYKYAIDQGKTHEQAIRQFENITSLTQQSKDLDQLSVLQRSGAFTRAMTMFMSAPNAYFRAEVRALRQVLRGKISKKEAAKKIALYHFILPMLFQFVSDGFEWDRDNQVRVFALGSLNGVFVIGDLISRGIARAQGDFFFGDNQHYVQFLDDIINGISDALTASDIEDLLDALQDISKGIGKGTGLPVEQGYNIAEGVQEVIEGEEVRRGTLRILGWPPGAVED